VGPRVGLDAVEKRNIPSPCQESHPDHLIIQPVASHSHEENKNMLKGTTSLLMISVLLFLQANCVG